MNAHETERLSAWLDDELAPEDRRVVDAHLEGCPGCRRRLAALRAADEGARGLPAEAPAGYFDDFAARVRARIAAEGPAGRPMPRRLPWPVWAGALAAALVLAVVVPRTLERAPEREGALPSRATGALETAASATPPTAPARPPAAAPRSPVVAGGERAPGSAPAPEPGTPRQNEARSEKKETGTALAGSPRRQVAKAPSTLPPGAPGGGGSPEPPTAGFAAAPPPRADEESAVRAREQTLREGDQPTAPTAGAAPRAEATQARVPMPESSEAASVATAPLARDAASARADDEGAYRHLLATTPADADGWRELRDAWRAFAATHPRSPRADEARVRAIEAGVAAWRAGGQAVDLERAEEDLAAYLGRDDARQKDRARRALETTRAR